MLTRSRIRETLVVSVFLLTAMIFSGCTNHLEVGWTQFIEGNYDAARISWLQNEKPTLPEEIAKAEAAIELVKLDAKIKSARSKNEHYIVIHTAQEALALDKWSNKDWLQKSPALQTHLDDAGSAMKEAHKAIEEEYFNQFSVYQNQKKWENITIGYSDYESYTSKYNQAKSQRIENLLTLANEEIQKMADEQKRIAAENARIAAAKARQLKLQAAINDHADIGKNAFLNEDYAATIIAADKGYAVANQNKDVALDTSDLEYLKLSARQAIKIQQEIEAERQRVAERERKRIEAENRKKAEAARKAELKKQKEEEKRIRLAKAEEKERLRRLEEERRKEAERKRKIEEENRRWRAFLAKGSPLKPLVTTVYKESSGIGNLQRGKKQKWQGGSQLPKPKDKSIASEDVYALEVEVPRTHKLTYLRNYSQASSKNLLSPSVVQGNSRSYYTEDFKGGRYYFEVRNDKSRETKYEVKARIYKIPVTN